MADIWPKDQPKDLEFLCLACFVDKVSCFITDSEEGPVFSSSDISLPRNLSDELLELLITRNNHLCDTDEIGNESVCRMLNIFRNRYNTVLTRLKLRHTNITTEQLKFLCQHPVTEVDISYCRNLKSGHLEALKCASKTLQTLRLAGLESSQEIITFIKRKYMKKLPGTLIEVNGDDSDSDVLELVELGSGEDDVDIGNSGDNVDIQSDGNNLDICGSGDSESSSENTLLQCPRLRRLCLRNMTFGGKQFVTNMMQQYGVSPLNELLYCPSTKTKLLESLTHLDLCGCCFAPNSLQLLTSLPCLISLCLSDVLNGYVRSLEYVSNISTLRHLDISQGDDDVVSIPVRYPEPEEKLRELLHKLPHLTSLDISGTNLAGYPHVRTVSHKLGPETVVVEDKVSGVPGLDGRTLEFLGLLDCAGDACTRNNIPADKVTGDANEEQILCSVHAYVDKPALLAKALNNLFTLFKDSVVRNQCSALEGIVAGMVRHKHDKQVQISGSASLFYIVKGEQKTKITHTQKRNVVDILLDSMEQHRDEVTMMRNGCLTMCHFNIPDDVMYCYNRLVSILLSMLESDFFHEDFIQRIGIFLLNCLACQVDGRQKEALGEMGTIETMCNIIKERLERGQCDEVLEVAWSTLWNVTDETAPNCEKFMGQDGMNLFLKCLKAFPEKDELFRNMMGLMGNIAEVKELRPQLMIPRYVQVFSDFLDSEKDGIEVSYNACGVMAHMMSDGVDYWLMDTPMRDEVLERMVAAIQRWPLSSKRNINYRSFKPILRLIECHHTFAPQYWATWALCNLTSVYPEKYCKLLSEEGGLELLRKVVGSNPDPRIKDLGEKIFTTHHGYMLEKGLDSGSMDVS